MIYTVVFSSHGSYEAEVEAESREEAIQKAYDEAVEQGDPEWGFEDAYCLTGQ